jgi:hypothetical protein
MKTSTLILFLVCINVFLIVGDMSFNLTTKPIDTVLSTLFKIPADLEGNETAYAYDFSSSANGTYNFTFLTSNIPRDKVSASSGTGSTNSNVGFLDALSIAWNLILFVFDMIFKCITFWFQIPNFSPIWGFIIAIPFGFMYIWAIVGLISGRDV